MRKVYFNSVSQLAEALRDNVTVYYDNCQGTHVVKRILDGGFIGYAEAIPKIVCTDHTHAPALPRLRDNKIYAMV